MKTIINDKEVEVKTVSINAKCSDLCFTELKDTAGNVLIEHTGYVPDFFPGKHYGDYVRLDIDVDTGKILNWKPTQKEVTDTLIEWEKS
jgi:hypothetical protein